MISTDNDKSSLMGGELSKLAYHHLEMIFYSSGYRANFLKDGARQINHVHLQSIRDMGEEILKNDEYLVKPQKAFLITERNVPGEGGVWRKYDFVILTIEWNWKSFGTNFSKNLYTYIDGKQVLLSNFWSKEAVGFEFTVQQPESYLHVNPYTGEVTKHVLQNEDDFCTEENLVKDANLLFKYNLLVNVALSNIEFKR